MVHCHELNLKLFSGHLALLGCTVHSGGSGKAPLPGIENYVEST